MTDGVSVPFDLWKDVQNYFLPLVSPCKDCLRGNLYACWRSDCAAFRFRNIARRIEMVCNGGEKPRYILVEDEILSALAMYGRPVRPLDIHVHATSSKANKHSAIKRLLRMGRIVEKKTPNGARLISLPTKGTRKNENNDKSTRSGTARSNPARKLGAGSSDARRSPRAI